MNNHFRWEFLETKSFEVSSIIIDFHLSILFSADLYLIIPQMRTQLTKESALSETSQNSEDNVIHVDYLAWIFYIRKKYLSVIKGSHKEMKAGHFTTVFLSLYLSLVLTLLTSFPLPLPPWPISLFDSSLSSDYAVKKSTNAQ